MDESFAFDVFLSHSSKDKPVVRPLAERLRADGLRVWLDEWELRPGDHIQASIEDALERSLRVLVLCMSANAFGSDWSQLEAGVFRFRDPLNRDPRFVPLRLDDAVIEGSLAGLVYVDWRKKSRGKRITRGFSRRAGRPIEGESPREPMHPRFEDKVRFARSYRSRTVGCIQPGWTAGALRFWTRRCGCGRWPAGAACGCWKATPLGLERGVERGRRAGALRFR